MHDTTFVSHTRILVIGMEGTDWEAAALHQPRYVTSKPKGMGWPESVVCVCVCAVMFANPARPVYVAARGSKTGVGSTLAHPQTRKVFSV